MTDFFLEAVLRAGAFFLLAVFLATFFLDTVFFEATFLRDVVFFRFLLTAFFAAIFRLLPGTEKAGIIHVLGPQGTPIFSDVPDRYPRARIPLRYRHWRTTVFIPATIVLFPKFLYTNSI